jgi:hypothetical protein
MPSTSAKQSRFMQAIANNPSFAKKVGVKQSVGKDFAAADKGKTFARGGVTQQKINKQNTRHGMMDLPVANLSRFSGMKKGGVMGKVKRYNGETEDGSEVYYDRDENPEAQEVERITSAGGVRMSPDYLTKSTPTRTASKKTALKFDPADVAEMAKKTADNEALISQEAAYRREDNRYANYPDTDAKRLKRFQDTEAEAKKQYSTNRANRTNAIQKAAAEASDDGKDHSSNILNDAGDVSGVVGGTALAGAALMGGNPAAARLAMSRVAAPAGRLFTKAKDALRSKEATEAARKAKNTFTDEAGKARLAKAGADYAKGRTPEAIEKFLKDNPKDPNVQRFRARQLREKEAAKEARAKLGIPQRGKLPGMQEGGKVTGFKKGGMMKESKAMVGKEMRFMKKKGAPASMIKHEKAEMGMKKGGMPMKDGIPAFMKKFAKGGGIESRGKTKGTVIRMASGGSVSSASRRADGIAQRGKTRC